MQTIRGRLTAWYSAALVLTLAAFAAVLYLDRRRASYQDLDQRMRSEASLTAGILAESYRARGVLVRPDTANRPVLIPDVAALLEAVPDILIVTAGDGSLLFASSDARALTFQQVEQLRRIATAPPSGGSPGSWHIAPDGPTIHYAVRSLSDAGPQFGAILAAANVRTAELGADQLLSTVALVLPFGVAVALLMGSWISRRALGPVDQIITEVREITDGRSLHRRLAEPLVKDELGRLAETLNQMIGRLERSFAALRRFTADASHELKTPLTVLKAAVERALTTPHLPAESLTALEEWMDEINRMTELVDALLTLARADEGLVRLHQEPVDLRALILETEETGELLAEPAGIEVSADAPVAPVIAPVDGSRIRQLVMNLLTNAVKYTPAGGRVRLWLERDDGRVRFGVSDTGIGIAPGDLPHIFDRFWRADSARTRTGERPGVGLGLAICKWIAEAHGGTIEVQSRPGRGTTFSVTLPVSSAPPQPPAAPAPTPQ